MEGTLVSPLQEDFQTNKNAETDIPVAELLPDDVEIGINGFVFAREMSSRQSRITNPEDQAEVHSSLAALCCQTVIFLIFWFPLGLSALIIGRRFNTTADYENMDPLCKRASVWLVVDGTATLGVGGGFLFTSYCAIGITIAKLSNGCIRGVLEVLLLNTNCTLVCLSLFSFGWRIYGLVLAYGQITDVGLVSCPEQEATFIKIYTILIFCIGFLLCCCACCFYWPKPVCNEPSEQ